MNWLFFISLCVREEQSSAMHTWKTQAMQASTLCDPNWPKINRRRKRENEYVLQFEQHWTKYFGKIFVFYSSLRLYSAFAERYFTIGTESFVVSFVWIQNSHLHLCYDWRQLSLHFSFSVRMFRFFFQLTGIQINYIASNDINRTWNRCLHEF